MQPSNPYAAVAAAALTLVLSAAPAIAAGQHDDHTPKHGGVMVAGKAADYELLLKADGVHLYVTDHGKPMDMSRGAAKVTVLNGSDKQEFTLVPSGDHLEAKAPVKLLPGAKAVAVVTVAGKPLGTARFSFK